MNTKWIIIYSSNKTLDSTVNQLLKIVHQIYQDINNGKDTCLVFLDVSKTFDKVWHKGVIVQTTSTWNCWYTL